MCMLFPELSRSSPCLSAEERSLALSFVSEAAIMRKLRQARHDTNATWAAGWLGWLPDSPLPHCSWRGIGCRDGRVVSM